MTVPLPNAKPRQAGGQRPQRRSRRPTKRAAGRRRAGAQPALGSAIAETGVRGQGFGLSTGGGVGLGSSLDIAGDFCCPDYLATMIVRIRSAWNQNQGAEARA